MTKRLVKIGLWGGPGTGKTTFLAVLSRAAIAQGWAVAGSGRLAEMSDEYLNLNAERLFNPADGSFPINTNTGTALHWTFRKGAARSRGVPRAFDVALWDVPGGWYENPANRTDEYIEHLADCDGLIYLFDPVNEAVAGNALTFTQNVLQDLARRVEPVRPENSRFALKHYVAFCVTKFDDPEFFRAARLAGWGTQDDQPPRQPRIKDEHAKAFYSWLCGREGAPPGAAAVEQALTAFFSKERIAYFVTSAIGFRLQGPRQTFDLASNFSNYDATHNSVFDPPEPINVLEPVLALARNIARRGARRWPR